MTGVPGPVQRVLEDARAAGRETLYETEALAVAAALGVGIPAHLVVPGPGEVEQFDLGMLLGDRVVVKALAPGLVHKTEAGGGAVVANEAPAISSAIAGMAERVPRAVAFMVAEHVEHGTDPGGEVLLGMRWTDEFGPVVTFGLGGTATEFLSGLAPGRAAAVFSPALRGGVAGALDRCAATGPLTRGFRGGAPGIDRAGLESLIGRALDLAARTMPAGIAEFEINPLAFTDRGPMALDAFCRVGVAGDADAVRPDLRPGAVAGILRPSTIGVIGVSGRLNLGRMILRNVIEAGFPPASVTVVKPGVAEIDGVRCVPDLDEMGFVDLLVVAVGAEQVPGLVEQVAAGSLAGGVILIPGGLGERPGSEAHAGRIAAALRDAPSPRTVVNGGNCMGIRSIPGRYDTTFIPAHKLTPGGREGRHPVAVISQSGAFAIARLDRLAWLDPAYLITVGNQVDLTVGDYLDHLADDPEVAVAACYVEGFRHGDGLRWAGAAARMRARGGTVILYRGGRTEAGARSAASHTAAVAGDTGVTRAVAEAAGALVADSLSDFEDLLRLAVLLGERPAAGARLGAVTNAGFEAVAIADNLGSMSLATLSPATTARIGEILESERLQGVVAANNPLDLTPNCTAAAYTDAVEAMLADPGVDVGLIGCVPLTPSLATLAPGDGHDEDVTAPSSLASRLVALWGSTGKPWAVVIDAGSPYDPMARMLEEGGIPTLRSADRALHMLGRWMAGTAG
ncbi:MAG: acetate--CoA ligase family protein [Actinobacteria bacterium]|nr:acetate--CoA ligase family protein [Actinomycetota bacterium]